MKRLFDSLSLRAKMLVSFASIVVIMCIVSGLSIFNLGKISRSTQKIYSTIPVLQGVESMKLLSAQDQLLVSKMISAPDDAAIRVLETAHQKHSDEFMVFGKALLEGGETSRGNLVAVEDESMISKTKDIVAQYNGDFLSGFEKIKDIRRSQLKNDELVQSLTNDLGQKYQQVIETAQDIVLFLKEDMDDKRKKGYSTRSILEKDGRWAELALNLKTTLSQASIYLVLVGSSSDQAMKDTARSRFESSMGQVNSLIALFENGGEFNGVKVFPLKDENISAQVGMIKDLCAEQYFPKAKEYIACHERLCNEKKQLAAEALKTDHIAGGIITSINDLIVDAQEQVVLARAEVDQFSYRSKVEQVAGVAIGIVFALIISLFFVRLFVKPITQIRSYLDGLSEGRLNQEKVKLDGKDELVSMAIAVNNLSDGLVKTSEFAQEIGQGNFSKEFDPLSDEDNLGHSLLEMRESLKKSSEEERRRNWITEGIAKFSDILRNQNSMEGLASQILVGLADYLDLKIGGIFVITDEEGEPKLELKGMYAYDREKFQQKMFLPGEGLVGECFIEEKKKRLTKVPSGYCKISSGLGEVEPGFLLLLPIRTDDKVLGVIEVAMMEPLEDYQVEFLETLANSMASTIESIRVSENTARLLKDSQKMQEELKMQEEEMRQNMEEMEATQESMKSVADQKDKEIAVLQQEISQLKGGS